MNGRFRVAPSVAKQIDQICGSDVSVFHQFVTSYRAVNKTLGGGEVKSGVVKQPSSFSICRKNDIPVTAVIKVDSL